MIQVIVKIKNMPRFYKNKYPSVICELSKKDGELFWKLSKYPTRPPQERLPVLWVKKEKVYWMCNGYFEYKGIAFPNTIFPNKFIDYDSRQLIYANLSKC